MLYNVVLSLAVQQSKSTIHIHISLLYWISFPFWSLQSIKLSLDYAQKALTIVMQYSTVIVIPIIPAITYSTLILFQYSKDQISAAEGL